jgi:hypothetical protein
VGLLETVAQTVSGAIATTSGMEVAKSSLVSLKNNLLSEPSMFLMVKCFCQSRVLSSVVLSFALLRSQFLRQIS